MKLTMNSAAKAIKVRILTETTEVCDIPFDDHTTAEDICTNIAKRLGIGPIYRHLFSLRLHDKKIWLYPCCLVKTLKSTCEFEYRIRFRVLQSMSILKSDVQAYNYYFHQVRRDILANKIPDISYEKCKSGLLGLSVSDMFRAIVEYQLPLETVEADYKKYIPKEIIKSHSYFIKRPVHDALSKMMKDHAGADHLYVKQAYMNRFDEMAPNYLSEEFRAKTDDQGVVKGISIKVNPFLKEDPGIHIQYENCKEWLFLCSIEDLCYISVRNDGTLEISRKNGIPSYFSFAETDVMYSFVSVLDGYYRLICKWTFNLCKEVSTPSLKKLYTLKCHGPVGGAFSYSKLEEKRKNEPGTFILRESETTYDCFFMDVCFKSSKPKSFKIQKIKDNDYLFQYDNRHYESIAAIITSYRKNKEDDLKTLECLPPSEFDKSQLLLCLPKPKLNNLALLSAEDKILTAAPTCINVKNLQIFVGDRKDGQDGLTYSYKCVWKYADEKKIEAYMKILKPEFKDKHLCDFLDAAGQWAFLQSSSILKLYGVTLTSPIAMITEYFKYGPFDEYLKQHKINVKEVDLVEASTYLANALWHLEESGFCHGNIRCSKLMVSVHNDTTCLVKLSDPGLHTYTIRDVPWIPPECYYNLKTAKTTTAGDVWAFGTTLWEIFSYGLLPPSQANKEFFLRGGKLERPFNCPLEINAIMHDCWDIDSFKRKKPQAIMRDINQVLYQVFNSRRAHSYATIFPKTFHSSESSSLTESTMSLDSDATAETFLVTDIPIDNLINLNMPGGNNHSLSSSLGIDSSDLLSNALVCINQNYSALCSPDISVCRSQQYSTSTTTSLGSITFEQNIFDLGDNNKLSIRERIGQGFYGEVYKGVLELSWNSQVKFVAVKKLKDPVGTSVIDLEREIDIMENLKHPNVVEIIVAVRNPEISLVMEYVEHGSLQSYLKIHREKLTAVRLLKFALDVATGMEYLGKKKVVHRDLAARNILVANENTVKISDFGLAQVVGQNSYYVLKTNRELPIKWYAPESLRDGKFSSRSDVWSYGVTLFEMFSYGEDPKLPDCQDHEVQTALLDCLVRGSRLPCPPTCPQEVYVKVMVPCWLLDSSQRPTFTNIRQIIHEIKLCP